jgi:hypothetical protein
MMKDLFIAYVHLLYTLLPNVMDLLLINLSDYLS